MLAIRRFTSIVTKKSPFKSIGIRAFHQHIHPKSQIKHLSVPNDIHTRHPGTTSDTKWVVKFNKAETEYLKWYNEKLCTIWSESSEYQTEVYSEFSNALVQRVNPDAINVIKPGEHIMTVAINPTHDDDTRQYSRPFRFETKHKTQIKREGQTKSESQSYDSTRRYAALTFLPLYDNKICFETDCLFSLQPLSSGFSLVVLFVRSMTISFL
jgi:hypothetical protein